MASTNDAELVNAALAEAGQINLVDGPSKFDLMLALFDKSSPERRVNFKSLAGSTFDCSVLSVRAEDGSRESWEIEGWASLVPVSGGQLVMQRYVKVYFHTGRRRGIITEIRA